MRTPLSYQSCPATSERNCSFATCRPRPAWACPASASFPLGRCPLRPLPPPAPTTRWVSWMHVCMQRGIAGLACRTCNRPGSGCSKLCRCCLPLSLGNCCTASSVCSTAHTRCPSLLCVARWLARQSAGGGHCARLSPAWASASLLYTTAARGPARPAGLVLALRAWRCPFKHELPNPSGHYGRCPILSQNPSAFLIHGERPLGTAYHVAAVQLARPLTRLPLMMMNSTLVCHA